MSHRQFNNKWAWSCANKTLFTKTGGWQAAFGPRAVVCQAWLQTFHENTKMFRVNSRNQLGIFLMRWNKQRSPRKGDRADHAASWTGEHSLQNPQLVWDVCPGKITVIFPGALLCSQKEANVPSSVNCYFLLKGGGHTSPATQTH